MESDKAENNKRLLLCRSQRVYCAEEIRFGASAKDSVFGGGVAFPSQTRAEKKKPLAHEGAHVARKMPDIDMRRREGVRGLCAKRREMPDIEQGAGSRAMVT